MWHRGGRESPLLADLLQKPLAGVQAAGACEKVAVGVEEGMDADMTKVVDHAPAGQNAVGELAEDGRDGKFSGYMSCPLACLLICRRLGRDTVASVCRRNQERPRPSCSSRYRAPFPSGYAIARYIAAAKR